MEKKKTIKRISAISLICICLIPLFAVWSSAMDFTDNIDQTQSSVMTGSTHIECIAFELGDGPNGGIGTRILVDYPTYFKGSSQTGVVVKVETSSLGEYTVIMDRNAVQGYERGSMLVATSLEILYRAKGQATPVRVQNLVKRIIIYYAEHDVHFLSGEFLRPYDGNYDASIAISTGSPNWVSNTIYNSTGLNYTEYLKNGNFLYSDYTVSRFEDRSYRTSSAASSVNGYYVPIGIKYNWTYVNPNTFYTINNGIRTVKPVNDMYKWSTVDNAVQTVDFETMVNGIFSITDMYTNANAKDHYILRASGAPFITQDDIEIGTFLRNSVENF